MWSILLGIVAGLRRAINQPIQELNRWQKAARFAYELGRFGAKQLKQDRAPQMASALAFRTLFGLAPIMVVTTILIKTIKGPEAIMGTIRKMLLAAGLDKLQVNTATAIGEFAPVEKSVTLADWLEDLTGQLVNTDMSAAGLIGFLVIIYAAIGLMVTIENSFNQIYRAADGRTWSRRLPLYWFILTISPILIGLTSYANELYTGWIDGVAAWQGILLVAKYAWAFGIAWVLIAIVYTLIPNATVHLRPACVGAFVATTLLWAGKNTLGAYLGNAFAINQLYGSLGLVPLFMFWVYLMWLAVLFGLEVSAILQTLHGRSLSDMEPPASRIGLADPTSILTMIEVISEHFLEGKRATILRLVEITSLPLPTVNQIVTRLVADGWLHRIDGPDPSVALARPPEQMQASEFLRMGYEMIERPDAGRTTALASQLRDAQRKAVDGITVAMLIPAANPTN